MKNTPIRRPDLEAERAKLRAVAIARGLGGLANDTKWRELIDSCYAMDWYGPRYRCKCIDSDYISTFGAEWHALPYPSIAIEWLDVTYVQTTQRGNLLPAESSDYSAAIEDVLRGIGLDYKKGKECFRVFGYAPRDEEGFEAI